MTRRTKSKIMKYETILYEAIGLIESNKYGDAEKLLVKATRKKPRHPDAYDCLGILAAVIAKTGADRKKIRQGLAAMNSPATGYKGVTGLTYFDSKGDCSKPAFIKKVENGKFVPGEK